MKPPIKLTKSSEYSFFNGIDTESIYKYYKLYAESYLKLNGYNIDLEFDYIRSPYIDAVIKTESSSKLSISLTEGTILRIYEFFYKINICSNNICEYSFSFEKEKNSGIKLISTDELKREIPVIFHICEDNRINAIAEYMSMFAIKFIILHELGHFLNGHCGYSIYNGRNNLCFHLNDVIDHNLTHLQTQALEIDADSYAACFLLNELDALIKRDDIILSYIKSNTDLYKLYAASIQGVCCLMDNDSSFNSCHPQPIARACLCIEGSSRIINNENCKDEMYKTLADVLNLSNTLVGKEKLSFLTFLRNYGKDAEKIESCWRNDMYYKVKPFALSPITNY